MDLCYKTIKFIYCMKIFENCRYIFNHEILTNCKNINMFYYISEIKPYTQIMSFSKKKILNIKILH